MRYYKLTCHTPYVGEDNDYYFKADNPTTVAKIIEGYVIENADEWYDEKVAEDYPDIEDYYTDCSYIWELITKEEYEEECPWDKEEEE